MTERCKHLLLIERPVRHVPVTKRRGDAFRDIILLKSERGGQPRCYPGQPNLAMLVALRTTLK